MISPTDQSPSANLKPHVRNITLLNGTDGDKSYASYGQVIRSTRRNVYHISGVFSYIYTNGVSSRPIEITQMESSAVLKTITHVWIERYLKHLSDMRGRLTGGPISYESKKNVIYLKGVEVDSLLNLNSRSLCNEFALPKNAIYHPANKNICPRCSIVYVDAISCGNH